MLFLINSCCAAASFFRPVLFYSSSFYFKLVWNNEIKYSWKEIKTRLFYWEKQWDEITFHMIILFHVFNIERSDVKENVDAVDKKSWIKDEDKHTRFHILILLFEFYRQAFHKNKTTRLARHAWRYVHVFSAHTALRQQSSSQIRQCSPHRHV